MAARRKRQKGRVADPIIDQDTFAATPGTGVRARLGRNLMLKKMLSPSSLSSRLLFTLAPLASLAPEHQQEDSAPRVQFSELEAPVREDSPAAFFELHVDEGVHFLGRPIQLRLVFGIESELRDENLIQLFQQRLGVPVQVSAPWLGALDCTTSWPPSTTERDSNGTSFVLNGQIVWGRQTSSRSIEAKTYRIFEYETSFTPTCAPQLVLPEASIRFASATEFRADLFGRKAALDRTEQRASAKSLTIEVAPLPEAGRPVEFVDAIGSFTIDAELDQNRVEAGTPVELTLRISGTGNLESLTAPRLKRSAFHLLGVNPSFDADVLVLSYELVADEPGLHRLPETSLAYFDPTPPGSYRTVSTRALQVRVVPRKAELSPSLTIALYPPRAKPPADPLWPIALASAALLALLFITDPNRPDAR